MRLPNEKAKVGNTSFFILQKIIQIFVTNENKSNI